MADDRGRDNVAIVREMYDVFNRSGVGATSEYYADDIAWHSDPAFPEGGTFTGREAVVGYMTSMFQNWAHVELRVEDLIAREDRVLALLTMHNTGRDGIEMEAFWGHLWTVKDGRMVDVRSFLAKDTALEAIAERPA
jgi:ketosteroid isomerase-like protein